MENIIFLDIDGVLNSVQYDRERNAQDGNIDETRLPLLKKLVEQTNARIVLTTSWRIHWEENPCQCDAIGMELNCVFRKHGLEIYSKTPVIGPHERAREIQAWLDIHGGQVDAFVIFDDLFGGWGHLESHLVKTDARIGRGLETVHIQKAEQILNM